MRQPSVVTRFDASSLTRLGASSVTRLEASAPFAGTDAAVAVAGYRVLRKLGSGRHADVYLARPMGADRSSTPRDESSEAACVALKMFRPEVPIAAIDLEALVLTRALSRHIIRLLDVATVPPSVPIFALQHLPGGSLARLFDLRRRLDIGEAITILVPLAQAVSALHNGGYGHANLSAASVLFDAWGAPVITGLGHCVKVSEAREGRGVSSRAAAGRSPVTDDIRRVARIVNQTLAKVEDTKSAAEGQDLVRWLMESSMPLDQLEDRLFALGDAVPVRLNETEPRSEPRVPARLLGRMQPAEQSRSPFAERAMIPEEEMLPETSSIAETAALVETAALAETSSTSETRGRGWLKLFHLPPEFAQSIERKLDTNPLGLVSKRLRAGVGSHKKPLILATAVASALLVMLLTVTAPDDQVDAAAQVQAGGSEPRQADDIGPTQPGDSASSETSVVEDEAIGADDPAAAALVLLRLRNDCLAQSSVLCLDTVDQAGSAIMDADRYQVRGMQQGERGNSPLTEAGVPTSDFEAAEATVVERVGDAALVSLQLPGMNSKPVSVLLMKGETGWRLRELFEY